MRVCRVVGRYIDRKTPYGLNIPSHAGMSLRPQGNPNMAEQTVILRLPELCKRVGLGRSTLYALVQRGQFPRPIPLSQRTVGWSAAEVEQWIAERIAQREGAK
jgi:prophage regulatory protein